MLYPDKKYISWFKNVQISAEYWGMSQWPNYSVKFKIYTNNKSLIRTGLPLNIQVSILMALAAEVHLAEG
jgi:hypothetical protein